MHLCSKSREARDFIITSSGIKPKNVSRWWQLVSHLRPLYTSCGTGPGTHDLDAACPPSYTNDYGFADLKRWFQGVLGRVWMGLSKPVDVKRSCRPALLQNAVLAVNSAVALFMLSYLSLACPALLFALCDS